MILKNTDKTGRVFEVNRKNPYLATGQAWRQHEASEFYEKQQRRRDKEWLELIAQQLRGVANSDKL